MRRLTLAFVAIFISISGCATRGAGYVPLVDMKGKSELEFSSDTADCQQYAKRRMDAGAGAAAGAIAGALLGAFLAPRGYKNEVAGKAAVLGGVAGAGDANESQEAIIKRCLAGRGYNVLD